jgi:hypothetical protein
MQDSDWNDPATRLDAQQLAARHPRKFSTTAITGLDTNPAAPNTNGQDYWAYASVRKGVTPDHSYYKNRALKSSLPMQTANGEVMRGDPVVGPAFATPAGSGHFIESSFYPRLVFRRKAAAPAGTGYSFRSSTSVVFIEADVNLFNSAVWIQPYSFLQVEALIHNSGYGIEMWLEGPGGGSIQAKIPKEASLEYQHPNAKTIWESGSPSMKDIWQRSDRCCYTLNGVSFAGLYDYEGYLRFGGTADPVLYGAFNYGESLIPMVSGRRVKIYFDEEVRRGFQPSSNYANVTRDTWSEVVAPW